MKSEINLYLGLAIIVSLIALFFIVLITINEIKDSSSIKNYEDIHSYKLSSLLIRDGN